ncbi:metaxin-1 [Dermatophagoides pteronyssinus]|uniref:metaxin-1 n=1 Tax=Dermatophagoides pteronyssinus TaxID=6956 RepID=UPI003F66F56D
MNQNEFQLNIFSGDFGSPSIHYDSLLAIAYCSLAGIKQLKINLRNDLYYNKLPSLSIDLNETIEGVENVIDHFETINYNSEFVKLNDQHDFDFISHKCLFENRLEPCLLYFHWYDEENYNENIGRWYAKKAPFPTNFLLPRLLRKESVEKLEKRFPIKILEDDNRSKLIEKKVISDAISCLNSLSTKLENHQYLFGSKPTKIDAYLYTYLTLLSQLPVKKEIIRAHIRSSPNLQQYLDRINQMEYLKQFSSISNGVSSSSSSTTDGIIDQDSYMKIKWTDVMFSGAIAALFMIYYAFSIGIIATSYQDDDDDDDDDEIEEEREHEQEQQQQ